MKSPDLKRVLDSFPAYKLHETFLLIRKLIAYQEVFSAENLTFLTSIEVEKIVDEKFRLVQLYDAIDVLQAVHKALYGYVFLDIDKIDLSAGIANAFKEPPSIKQVDGIGKQSIRGIMSIPFQSLDEELSKREGENPIIDSKKITVCIDFLSSGLYRYDDISISCQVRGRGMKYIKFIVGNGKVSVENFIDEFGVTKSNLIRDIKNINKNFKEKFQVSVDFIISSGSGYCINMKSYHIFGGVLSTNLG